MKGLTSNSPEYFVELLMRVGVNMLSCGGEVKRVEETLERMGKAYGALAAHVFVITSSINVTLELDGENAVTRIRRVHGSGTDFTMLEELNTLSRKYCAGKLSLEDVEKTLDRLENEKMPVLQVYLGSIIAASSFVFFFGGNVLDALIGSAAACIVAYLQLHLEPLCKNKFSFNILTAVIIGFSICIVTRMMNISYIHRNEIISGTIMLLVPGIAITNSIRDLMVGDTLAGFLRLVEAIVWAGALAIGFMIPIYVFGG